MAIAQPHFVVAETHEIVVRTSSFSPNDLTIVQGDSVRWVSAPPDRCGPYDENCSAVMHTVTADDFSFTSGAPSENISFTREFDTSGEVLYHCEVHSSPGQNINTAMNGRISVISASVPAELAMQSVSAGNGTYEPGAPITVDASIDNSGDADSGVFTIGWYASTDGTVSTADISLASEQLANISGGTTLNFQTTFHFPENMPDGMYYIGAIIAFADGIAANNTAVDETQITIKARSELSVNCNDDFVLAGEDEFVINVTATGVDDTQNLQCALDAAVSSGMPVVRLTSATYRISSVVSGNFTGTLEGVSKSGTTLEILDNSIDCAAMEANGRTSAAIKFDSGKTRIRRMTIMAESPCLEGALQTVIHFTGGSALAGDCSNDVMFGEVDRVDMFGPGIFGMTKTAVLVNAEGNLLGGCKQTLLGTFKLNRSTVSGFDSGIVVAMKSAAQVDINTNGFSDNLVAINLTDSNQNATLTSNTFEGDNTLDTGYTGILAGTTVENAPAVSRVVINNNTFNIAATFATPSNAVFIDQKGKIANISTLVTNNRFNLEGASTSGLISTDVNKGHVSANRFSGNALTGIRILADRINVTGWTVTSNTGFPLLMSSQADIVFGENTSQCIVGAGQGATFVDQSEGDNQVLATSN